MSGDKLTLAEIDRIRAAIDRMPPLEPPVMSPWILEIDHTWHPGWHHLIDCGFVLVEVPFKIMPGIGKVETMAVLAVPRPVGGTHRRTLCQVCGGARSPTGWPSYAMVATMSSEPLCACLACACTGAWSSDQSQIRICRARP